MNEIAFQRPPTNATILRQVLGTKENRRSSAFYGYSLCLIAIGLGWLARDKGLVAPGHGLGYWLGIVGTSMMLLLLLYPLRKRTRVLRFLGSTTHWYRTHIIFGLLGPMLVLYHSNFHLGSFNSQFALYSMLLVAVSGIIGQHLYAPIHRELHGRKTTLDELHGDLAESLKSSHGLAALLPNLISKLQALSAEVQGDTITGSLGTGTSLLWTVRRYVVWISLLRTAHRELRVRAVLSPTVAQEFRRLKKASSVFVRDNVRLMGRVAQFTLYEKFFSLWHVLHLPLFYLMVVSALVHVLAVHMY
jgi:hypothetical protein